MEELQHFSLRWNNYVQHITRAFNSLRSEEDLVDVTLSCEGKKIYAHKMLLSACSNYFKDVFKENPCKHPVIIFRNVKFEDLVAIIDFMYHGEVNVEQERLSSFLTTAEMLAVRGLTTVEPGASKEGQVKKRPTNQDLPAGSTENNNSSKVNSQKTAQRTFGTPNIPSSNSFPLPQSPRSTTPITRKRPLSPPTKPNNVEKEVKRRQSEVVVPKIEVEDNDDEGSFEDQDSIVDDSQLDMEIEAAQDVKLEPENLEIGSDKVPTAEQLKAGPSTEAQDSDFNVDEEYLDEHSLSPNSDNVEPEEQTTYYLMGDDEMQLIDASSYEEDSKRRGKEAIILRDVIAEEEDDVAVLVTDPFVIEDDVEKPDMRYIYAEGISDKNEIIIGQMPRFKCEHCDRTFKRLDSLHKHNSVHLGRTTCSICGTVFSRVAHLTRHMKMKHPEAEILTGRKRRKDAN